MDTDRLWLFLQVLLVSAAIFCTATGFVVCARIGDRLSRDAKAGRIRDIPPELMRAATVARVMLLGGCSFLVGFGAAMIGL